MSLATRTRSTRSTLRISRGATLFHALSDSTRLAIVDMLRDGELCVCELQAELDAAQSRLSFHLRVLKDAGVVQDRREGRWAYYRLVPESLVELHDFVVEMQPRDGALPMFRSGSCCG